MALIDTLKKNAVLILTLIAIVAIGSAIYERFFSDTAKLVATLKGEIKEKEARIEELQAAYAQLNEEEGAQLEVIANLRSRLEAGEQKITSGEAKLNDFKKEFLGIDSALSVIEAHTRGALDRSRSVLPPAPQSPSQ